MKNKDKKETSKPINVSIRKGDTVVVIAGKDKGKKGKVQGVLPEEGRVVVDGVNVVIKHKKARNAQSKSSRDKKPAPIDISNVQILCKCGKATRVGHKEVNGRKTRVCAKCGEVLDKKYVKIKEKEKVAEDKAAPEAEDKVEKKPLQRREIKHQADSKIKTTVNKTAGTPSAGSTHRKVGS